MNFRLLSWLAAAFVLLFAATSTVTADSTATGDAGRPMAVLFYADWCTTCKVLDPKYEQARAGLDPRIQFVKLDVTDDATQAKARKLATQLGIGALYSANQATGWVALLDAQHHKVGELHQDETADEMRAALEKLAAAS